MARVGKLLKRSSASHLKWMSENDPKLSAREATADVRAPSLEQSPRGADGRLRRARPTSRRINRMRTAFVLLLAMVVSLPLTACDSGSRSLDGRFRVRQVVTGSDTAYYLWATSRPENDVSLNGQLMRVGSDGHKLVALFASPPTARGFAARWTAFDLNGDTHSEVMTDEQRRQNSNVARVVTYRADSAWARAKGK